MINRINTSRFLQGIAHDGDNAAAYYNKYPPGDWEALEELIENLWFTRVWIIQEVVASRYVELRYGDWTLSWSRYSRAIAILQSSGLRNFINVRHHTAGDRRRIESGGIDNALVMENLRQWYGRFGAVVYTTQENRLLCLEETLKLCLRFQSKKKVDKIFALLGLISDREELGITPEYEGNALGQVFTNVALQMIERSRNPIRVLRFAGIGEPRELQNIPSWAPDWTAGIRTCVLSTVHATGYRASWFTEFVPPPRIFGNKLQFKGAIVDTIVGISPILSGDPDPGTQPFNAALNFVRDRQGGPYLNGSTIDEAFWRTTLGDTDTYHRPVSWEYLDGWKRFVQDGETPLPPDPTNEAQQQREYSRFLLRTMDTEDNKYRHLLSSDLSQANPGHRGDFCSILGAQATRTVFNCYSPFAFGRRVCVTRKKYIGLVPQETQEGDAVAIFMGASTPHILRASKDVGSHSGSAGAIAYQLVGETYIHGGMDGELMPKTEGLTGIVLI
jgi:hypothetical protein